MGISLLQSVYVYLMNCVKPHFGKANPSFISVFLSTYPLYVNLLLEAKTPPEQDKSIDEHGNTHAKGGHVTDLCK
jgi:hypothetical protein